MVISSLNRFREKLRRIARKGRLSCDVRAAKRMRRRPCGFEPLEVRTLLSASLPGTEAYSVAEPPLTFDGMSSQGIFLGDGPVKRATVEFAFHGSPEVNALGPGHSVSLEGVDTWLVPGDPVVPVDQATLLLPQGTQITDVAVEYLDSGMVLAQGVQLTAAPAPGTLEEPALWTSVVAGSFPTDQGVTYSNYTLAGYRLGSVQVFPVQYEAATETLSYHSRIVVTVTAAPVENAGELSLRDSEADRARVVGLVDNPEMLESYETTESTVSGAGDGPMPLTGYEYVVITSTDLADEFQPLVDQKIGRGLTAGIFTTDYIYANYDGMPGEVAGGDNPDKIREFIADAYANWGTQWVLLGGDVEIVPKRGVYVNDGSYVETSLPTDLYYACLDGPWNSDGDSRWGEYTDGSGGSDIDLVAEVFVGRAPVSNATEATNFVDKTIQYETTQHPNATTSVFLGEKLDTWTYGKYSSAAIRDATLSGDWLANLTERYEKDAPWTASQLIADLNASPNMVHHLGHGNVTSNAKLTNSDVAALTNEHPYFMYSQACDSGAFDASDAIGEKHVVSDHGAFAVVMNSRYGWYAVGSTPGYSHYFALEFWDAVFNEGKLHLGEANQDSKDDNRWRVGAVGAYRWIYFATNLLGDPETSFQGLSVATVDPLTTTDNTPPLGGRVSDATATVEVTVDGSSWTATNNGDGTWTLPDNTISPPLADGRYDVSVSATVAGGGVITDSTTDELLVDTTAPTSAMYALDPRQSTQSFWVSMGGTDPEPGPGGSSSGIESYDLYVSVDGAPFQFWTNVVPDFVIGAEYPGESNHSYAFCSIARDVAGNVESKALVIEAGTYVPDLTPPETEVTSVDSSGSLFTVSFQGTDSGGTGLMLFTVEVSVDDGAAQTITAAYAGAPTGGVYSGSIQYQAILDGSSHTYRFFTVGTDRGGNTEAAPTSPADVVVTKTFGLPSNLSVTAFDVQKGATERSFVRYLDVTFDRNDGLVAIVDSIGTGNDRVELKRYELDGSGGVAVSLESKAQVVDRVIAFDFGEQGIGGNRNSNVGDGYYELAFDLNDNGTMETVCHFYRLLGDVTGDGAVAMNDIDAISAALGLVGTHLEEDVNGDARVNGFDRIYAALAVGRELAESLPREDGWRVDAEGASELLYPTPPPEYYLNAPGYEPSTAVEALDAGFEEPDYSLYAPDYEPLDWQGLETGSSAQEYEVYASSYEPLAVTDGSDADLIPQEDYDVYAPDESYYDPIDGTISTDTGSSTTDYDAYYGESEPTDWAESPEGGYSAEDYDVYGLDYDPFGPA